MTPKEVEHFLIENNFEYKKDNNFSFWLHKSGRPQVTDNYIQEKPEEAFEFVRGILNATARNRSRN